jgi:hypothetical protein
MKKTLLLIFVALWGCSPKQVKQLTTVENPNPVEVKVKAISDNSMEFTVVNHSKTSLNIYQYYNLHIEQKEGDKWIPLRILPCPCGAPCAKPAEFVSISAGESMVWEWNLHESWCGELVDGFIPATKSQRVKPGEYRIRVLYSLQPKEQATYYKMFTIN